MSKTIPLNMIFDIFKHSLKEKKMTYADLGKAIGLSESGIKKIFMANDCSYSRLNDLSEALDLSLVDILNSTLDHDTKEIQFTIEQERFFLKHPDCFAFFWKLVQERESIGSIKNEYGLSEKQIHQFLKKLDDFKIIEWHPNEYIKIPKMEKIRWVGHGPLLKWIKSKWPEQILKDVNNKERLDENEHFSLRFYKLTKKSQIDLVQAIRLLDDEFAERSLREFKSGKKLGLMRMVSAISPGSYVPNITK